MRLGAEEGLAPRGKLFESDQVTWWGGLELRSLAPSLTHHVAWAVVLIMASVSLAGKMK